MRLVTPWLYALSLILKPTLAHAAVDLVGPASHAAAFPLVTDGKAAPICILSSSESVVQIAACDLAQDIEQITGKRPEILHSRPDSGARIEVFISPEARGRWETYRLAASADRLIIQGSDKRALAYGIYDLSRRIGVSPWSWWADVPVKKSSELRLSLGSAPVESPAVKYRGIFINDEDWGLEPWARRTYEPEVGNIGPKTYGRIFKLLLRLRANTIWPGMHPTTTPFHQVPGNAKTADEHAIIIGSSHAEPMLRNNVGEWKKPHHEYDFLAHRDTVLNYWEERVKQRTSGESIITLGMRGIHDSPIVGPKSQQERIRTLESIFREQRRMLETHLGAAGGRQRYSQMFCPYKEVLGDYLAGLKVPEDVTIVWPDDNFGYVRRFATPEERKRPGGLGVYYHLSYLGSPLSWLWFDSLPPALVWSEMTRAYEQGAKTLWIGNVGDIKGNELSTEYFLNLAWDAGHTTPEHPSRFLHEVAERDFGKEHAEAIVDVWRRHQALAFARKPEHLQWHFPGKSFQPTTLTEAEMNARLDAYAALERDAEAIAKRVPTEAFDAFYQLVGYPVAAAAAANERYFRAELARLHKARGKDDAAHETFATAARADQRMTELTRIYNEEIADGKWRHVIRVLGIANEGWLSNYLPTRELPSLDSSAQKAVKVPEPAPRPKPPVVPADARPGDFIERDGVVSIHAGHFMDREDLRDGSGWRSIPGLGRTGSAVTVLPSTAAISNRDAPRLSYRFHIATGGKTTIRVRLLPTHPLVTGQGLRFALAIDNGQPLPVVVTSGFDTGRDEWKHRVLANATEATVKLPRPLSPGWHTLHLIAVDTGVVVDKFVIDLGGLRPSYDGPPESRID